ncbi:MAG: hypothetical protein V7L11_26765 [Nostoc sp.]
MPIDVQTSYGLASCNSNIIQKAIALPHTLQVKAFLPGIMRSP